MISIAYKPAITCESLSEPVRFCPTLDLSDKSASHYEFRAFLDAFTACYFGFALEHISARTDLYDELEANLYGKSADGTVVYQRFGIDRRDPEHTGILDRGFSVHCYLNDLLDALGMDVSCTADEPVAALSQAQTVGDVQCCLEALLRQQKKLV